MPDQKTVRNIVQFHLSRTAYRLSDDEWTTVIGECKGLCGADIAAIVNYAVIIATRRAHSQVCLEDLMTAKQRNIKGAGLRASLVAWLKNVGTRYIPGGKELGESSGQYYKGTRG